MKKVDIKYSDGKLDKFYTEKSIVDICVKTLLEVISIDRIDVVIEPSAGNGAFISSIKNNFPNKEHIFLDILPEHDEILQQDYMEFIPPKKSNILVIGNPPFGNSNHWCRKFYKKSCEFAEYIAFILPISQLGNSPQMYEFDLLKSIDLGEFNYSGKELHCCFNVYKRPVGKLNKKPKIDTDLFKIIELRRGGKTKSPPNGYFYSMCNFGAGCFGKTPEYEGQFCQELYFYSDDEVIRNKIISLLEFNKIREFAKNQQMTSRLKVSKMRIYEYILKNIGDKK